MMDNEELNKLAEIIKIKIYNESTSFQEIIASFYGESKKFQIDIEAIPEDEIKENIKKHKDMNVIGNKIVMIPTDLNEFLKNLMEARKKDDFINEEYVQSLDSNELAYFISEYLSYHTNQENLEMKKMFLKRMGLFHFSMDEDQIESVFFNAFSLFYEEETKKQGR